MPVSNPDFNPSGSPVVADIKQRALELEKAINQVRPGRRRSIALTHLETASMWAVKAAVAGDGE